MKNRQCFLHDACAASDRKMLRILENSGPEGYGIIWLIVERMRQEEDLTFSLADIPMYARVWNTTEKKILTVIELANGIELFRSEGDLQLITAPALRRDVAQLKEKQEKWRSEKRNKKDSEKKTDGKENFSGTEKEEVRTLEDRTKKKEKRSKKKEAELKTPDELASLGKCHYGKGEFVWLTPKEYGDFCDDLGRDFVEICIEKLDGWIGGKPTKDKIINGQNAAYTFRSWVIDAVTEKRAKAEKIQGNGPLKPHQVMSTQQRTALETVKFFEERERNAPK